MSKFTMHGPMYQFECETCGCMGDCWDTEAEAEADIMAHDCLASLPDWVRIEIGRLRAAGNGLAVAYRTLGGLDVSHDAPLRAWEEARRG